MAINVKLNIQGIQ